MTSTNLAEARLAASTPKNFIFKNMQKLWDQASFRSPHFEVLQIFEYLSTSEKKLNITRVFSLKKNDIFFDEWESKARIKWTCNWRNQHLAAQSTTSWKRVWGYLNAFVGPLLGQKWPCQKLCQNPFLRRPISRRFHIKTGLDNIYASAYRTRHTITFLAIIEYSPMIFGTLSYRVYVNCLNGF